MSIKLANTIAKLSVDRRFANRGEERIGQCAMNALYEYSPEIYNAVSGTQADCFHRDDLVVPFYLWLEAFNEEAK